MEVVQLTQEQLDNHAKTIASLAREGHRDSVSKLLNEQKYKDKAILEKLEQIHSETKKTNGRVTKLEDWANEHQPVFAVMQDHVRTNRNILFSVGSVIGIGVIGSLLSLIII